MWPYIFAYIPVCPVLNALAPIPYEGCYISATMSSTLVVKPSQARSERSLGGNQNGCQGFSARGAAVRSTNEGRQQWRQVASHMIVFADPCALVTHHVAVPGAGGQQALLQLPHDMETISVA